MESTDSKFVSYKKVLISGERNVGKTTLIQVLESSNMSEYNKKVVLLSPKGTKMCLNLHEIDVDNDMIQEENEWLFKTYFHDCQLAIFMADLTNVGSVETAKNLISFISEFKLTHLKKLMVFNKLDQEKSEEIKALQLDNFLAETRTETLEISVTQKTNTELLFSKIASSLDASNELAVNLVSECVLPVSEISFEKLEGKISILLLGNSAVGKTSFCQRYFKNSFSEKLNSTIGIVFEKK